jgi:hypothetical protein
VNEPIPVPTTLNAEIPEPIQKVILKSMAKNPEERYRTANTMANELRAAIRMSNMEMGAAVPTALLQDKPTPPPLRTVPSATPSGLAETMLPATSAPAGAEMTRVAASNLIDQTNVAAPPALLKKRSRVPFIIAGIVLLFIIGAIAGGIVLANRGNGDPTPTSLPVALEAATDTPEPPTEAAATATMSEETAAQETVDIGATAAAAVAIALTNQPTDTPLPTPSVGPSSTPTPDVTATFLASCDIEVELDNFYTFQNENAQSAPVNSDFQMNWVITNSGTCPVPADASWTYVEGEEFDQVGPVALTEELAPGEETTITSPFSAPSQPGTYESTWQLVDAEGNPLGSPQSFEIFVYEPVTPTPTVPTPTPTPMVTATPTAPLSFNISTPYNCEYDSADWVCQITIFVNGGVGPYTVTVTGTDPPATYNGAGPSFTHTIRSRRCFNWNQGITVQDNTTGESVNQGYSLNPDDYFTGGCSETDPPG